MGGCILPSKMKYKASATAMLSTTIPAANKLSVIPPFLKKKKNEGPTCKPMQNTKVSNRSPRWNARCAYHP